MALPWRPFPQGYPLVSPRWLTLDSQPENEPSNLEAANWQPLSRTRCAKWVILLLLLLLVSVFQAPLAAQLVKDPPAMQETLDLLEKGTATHSSILAWRIPWTVHSPWGRKELDVTE